LKICANYRDTNYRDTHRKYDAQITETLIVNMKK
jgi:hypothetical protein